MRNWQSTPAGTAARSFCNTTVKSSLVSVKPVPHMTLASMIVIRSPLLVHSNVDGLSKAMMEEPKTKKGKAEVNDARTWSSRLDSEEDDDDVDDVSPVEDDKLVIDDAGLDGDKKGCHSCLGWNRLEGLTIRQGVRRCCVTLPSTWCRGNDDGWKARTTTTGDSITTATAIRANPAPTRFFRAVVACCCFIVPNETVRSILLHGRNEMTRDRLLCDNVDDGQKRDLFGCDVSFG